MKATIRISMHYDIELDEEQFCTHQLDTEEGCHTIKQEALDELSSIAYDDAQHFLDTILPTAKIEGITYRDVYPVTRQL